VQDSNLRPR